MKRSYEVVCEKHDRDVPNLKNNIFSLKKTPQKYIFMLSSKKIKRPLNNTKAAALWSDILFEWYQLKRTCHFIGNMANQHYFQMCYLKCILHNFCTDWTEAPINVLALCLTLSRHEISQKYINRMNLILLWVRIQQNKWNFSLFCCPWHELTSAMEGRRVKAIYSEKSKCTLI